MSQIAAIQLRSEGSPADRLQRAGALIDAAVARGARLLVLPENFAYFGARPCKATLKTGIKP